MVNIKYGVAHICCQPKVGESRQTFSPLSYISKKLSNPPYPLSENGFPPLPSLSEIVKVHYTLSLPVQKSNIWLNIINLNYKAVSIQN